MSETLGRYELIAEIGRGGMADVKLAMQRGPAGFEKLVVLKLVHDELASDKQVVGMLLDEARLSAQLKHPNVVDVYELGEVEGRYFIAMEYLEGESLLSILDRGHAGKKLDPLSTARIIADTAEGLEAAHTLKSRDGKPLGLVHHDISLGNIFVLYSGQVKLLDFGVAKAAHTKARRDSATGVQKVFGKLAYMAPEKLDERPGDRRSDIWSLGCVLWESLTFKRLFKGANDVELIREVRYVNVPAPSTVNPDVPPELDAIVHKALQRDPFKRYQSAQDMAIALDAVLTARNYPAKNYQIAGYMMATFADQIAARERLLREVSGTTRPSAEVIDAAFGDPAAKKESALPTIDSLLEPENQVVLPEDSTGADPAIAVPLVPAAAAPTAAESLDDLHRSAEELREHPPSYRKRIMPIAIGLAAMLLIVMVVTRRRGGGGGGDVATPTATSARIPLDAAAPVDAIPPPSLDAATLAVTPPIDAAPIDAAPDEIEMPPDNSTLAEPPDAHAPPDKPDKPERHRPTKSAQQLYAEGLAAWNKHDTSKAYALFTEGRRAGSSYPNNWYGLGLVHEKLGRKGAAKIAFERYLKLAPKAANAKALREHIKNKL